VQPLLQYEVRLLLRGKHPVNAKILIVEDERITALNLEERLKKLGYGVVGNVGSAERALELIAGAKPDVVLMDIQLDGVMDGISAAHIVREEYGIPVVYLTANADAATLERAVQSVPFAYLLKPFEPRELDATLRVVLARHQLEQAHRADDLRLRLAFDAAEMGGWEIDPVNGMVRRSGHTDQLFGLESSPLDLPLETFLERVVDADRETLRALLHNCHKEGKLFSTEFRCQREVHSNDDEIVWLKAEGRMFKLQEGLRVIGVLQDISAAKTSEAQLRLAAEVFNNTGEALFITDSDGLILTVNSAYGAIMDTSQNDSVGRLWPVFEPGNVVGASLLTQLKKTGYWQGEIQARRVSGETFPIWLNISATHTADGAAQHFVGMFSDMSALREAQGRLKKLAYYDALTELPNRVLLLDRLQHAIDRADRTGGQVGLLFLDLDHFKQVNDSLGHDAGDACLQEAARRMRCAVRAEDTVARLSGDEFMVLLDVVTQSEQAATVAAKLIEALSEPFLIKGQAHHLSASIGIALYPQDDATAMGLLKSADIAMYDAKTQGRQRYRFFNQALSQQLSQALLVEHKLHQALTGNELVLHYQPQLDRHGRWCAAEALLRWAEPGAGLHYPLAFLAVADNAGLMPQITQWVLDEACRQMADWRSRGIVLDRLAINVPPQVMCDPGFPQRVSDALAHYNLPAGSLEIELTEVALQTGSACIDTMYVLAALGIALALDDFGTGYSSMKSLKHLPLHCIKIDHEFVADMLTDPTDAAITDTVLTLARNLNMETVAEGVETKAQRDYLLERNCHLLQGYLFSHPLPAEAFETQFRLSLATEAAH
jgi:diguanylate cyclase (GGDEF)-like protein/PAS domain S-box-containing protein